MTLAAVAFSGTLRLSQDGNGLADYTKLEDLIGNGLGSHQGHITWSVSPAFGP